MVDPVNVLEINSPERLSRFFRGRKPKLWSVGDPSILSRRLLGIISARQTDSDLALKSSQLLKELPSLKEVAFVGGWHAPLEEEALRILVNQGAQVVFCVSKSLNRFDPPAELARRVENRGALLLTHCSAKAKRISREASIRRNELVIGLATAVLILSAPTGSASLKLAKSALSFGKPVLTPEHRVNDELLKCRALPATLDNIQAALGS
jgi:predicted Rossmann fold nucleotide-binding protein DprA/Smf involved in DNA uptake